MNDEPSDLDAALACVDSDSAGHWPTVAGILADAYRTLKAKHDQCEETLQIMTGYLGSMTMAGVEDCLRGMLQDSPGYDPRCLHKWEWHATGVGMGHYCAKCDGYKPHVSKTEPGCGQCGGIGTVDSGGVTPWGAGINVPCPTCNSPANAIAQPPAGDTPETSTPQ